MATYSYVVQSFPAPVIAVDNSEGAAYVANTTVVISSPAPVQSSTGFTQGFYMIPCLTWFLLWCGVVAAGIVS